MSDHPHASRHQDYEHRVSTTEAERIALAASKLAGNDILNETFALFGVARGNVESVEEFKKDLMFVRTLRKRPELWQDVEFLHALRQGSLKAGSRVFFTILTIVTGGVVVGFWAWFWNWVKVGAHG
jgi:hypothetical protein